MAVGSGLETQQPLVRVTAEAFALMLTVLMAVVFNIVMAQLGLISSPEQ
jgi:hypothetical protein